MKSRCYCLKVASVLFLLVAVGHLVRVIMGWKLVVGDWTIPMWPSYVVIVVSAALDVLVLQGRARRGGSAAGQDLGGRRRGPAAIPVVGGASALA
jgi:hypothetical protein